MIRPFLNNIYEFQESEIPIGHLGFVWLGQGGYLFRSCSKINICVDPYLSNSVERIKGLQRITPIPIQPQDLRVDFILISHEHLDHLDPDTIPGLAKANPNAVFISQQKQSLITLGIMDDAILCPEIYSVLRLRGFFITPVPAFHQVPAIGFVLSINGISVYVSGDTLYHNQLLNIARYNPDIMIICINGKLGNMSTEDAARLTQAIRPRLVIPSHYGMFAENTVNPQDFETELRKIGFESSCAILDPSQPYLFSKDAGSEI